MADLQAFPFESAFEGYDAEDNPIYDRAIASATYRLFWKKYFTNGIFFEPSTNFQALAAGGLNVDVSYGEAHIEGLTILPGDATTVRLTLPNALTTGDRTDLIVLRADFTANRAATVYALAGKSTVADLQRDDAVWELALARVIVRRNALSVNQADITDLRLSTEFCGLVTEPITRTNTDAFFVQLDQMMVNYGIAWTDFFTEKQQQWIDYFDEKQQQTDTLIAENQQRWDEFYADIGEDISVLIENATIRQDQVTGLTEALDAIPQQLADQDQRVTMLLANQDQRIDTKLAEVDDKLEAASTKQYTASVTPGLWTGSSAPYTATVPVAGVPASAKGSVGLADTATVEEREAARNAMITVGASVAANQVVLIADGDKPTIALPILVTVWG